MAKGRVSITLLVSSQAIGDSVKSSIDSWIIGKSLFSFEEPIVVWQDREGQWLVTADIRFNIPTDAQEWFDDIRAKWTTGPLSTRILTGSIARIHTCLHDDIEVKSCESTYLKVTK